MIEKSICKMDVRNTADIGRDARSAHVGFRRVVAQIPRPLVSVTRSLVLVSEMIAELLGCNVLAIVHRNLSPRVPSTTLPNPLISNGTQMGYETCLFEGD